MGLNLILAGLMPELVVRLEEGTGEAVGVDKPLRYSATEGKGTNSLEGARGAGAK